MTRDIIKFAEERKPQPPSPILAALWRIFTWFVAFGSVLALFVLYTQVR